MFAFQAVLDALARARAEKAPLHRCLEQLSRDRRWGKRERGTIGDVRAAWERRGMQARAMIDARLKARGGRKPPVREQDKVALLVALELDGRSALRPELDPPTWSEPLFDAVADPSAQMASALPAFFKAALERQFGADAPAVAAGLLGRGAPAFGVDLRNLSPQEACDALTERGHPARIHPWVKGSVLAESFVPLAELPPKLKANLWPMDPGSRAVTWAVGAKEGMRVLDMCGGGGGKTRALFSQKIEPIVHDLSKRRIEAALKRVPQLRTHAVQGDGTRTAFASEMFDRVLIDAPCTASGTLRRHPERLPVMEESALLENPKLQRALIHEAARVVKRGGVILYVTCSVFEEENDAVIDAALAADWGLASMPLKSLWGEDVAVDLPKEASRVQLLPSKHDCDAFFMAALKRV
jgi:16S rRNA (cytosine967-C5)-methyltransferase